MNILKRFYAMICTLLSDTKAVSGMQMGIISVVLSLFLAGILLPIAMRGFFTANYTGLDSTVITVITVLVPVLAGIGIAIRFLHIKGD